MPTGSTLAPTERRVLRHEVLQTLRTGILAGELVPGTRLREVPLAAEFGVSRGPLREALRQLEQEGLVEFHTHRGAVVVGVADTEIETIYGIRSLLEEQAFASASRVITDDDLEQKTCGSSNPTPGKRRSKVVSAGQNLRDYFEQRKTASAAR